MIRAILEKQMQKVMKKKDFLKWRFGQLHPNDVEMYMNRIKKTKDNEDD